MFGFSSTSPSARLWTAAFVSAAAMSVCTPARATVVPAGGTLDPVPGTTLPAGSVLETTINKPFEFNKTVYVEGPGGIILPLLRTVSGTLTQRVYRTTDNTITFGYSVSVASDSGDEVTEFSVRDFSEYSTNISQFGGLAATQNSVSSATRSVDGGSIECAFDTGITVGWSSRVCYVDTDATAYSSPGRFVPVSSRATVCSGGACLNVYGLAYPVEDSTPPIVSLSTPAALTSVCSPAAITGRAYDPNGFDSYELEYAANPNGPWTQIATSNAAVSTTGPLGSWNTSSPVNVAQGYYFLRLTAYNTTGMSSSVTNMVYVDKQFDTVDVRAPQTGQILGGGICFDGSVTDNNGTTPIANYTISYAPLPAGAPYLPVNPGTSTYPNAVINDGLGSWLTSSGPAAVADGAYRVRVTGTDQCGHSRSITRDITVDNTAPVAVISAPATCSSVSGLVAVTGTVSDLHLSGWVLQYSGGESHGWVTIASGSGNINGNTIAVWNTAGLDPCAYTLRLVAADSAGINCSGNTNQTEYHISVSVGCAADFNRSGAVSVQDIFDYLNAYFAGCP